MKAWITTVCPHCGLRRECVLVSTHEYAGLTRKLLEQCDTEDGGCGQSFVTEIVGHVTVKLFAVTFDATATEVANAPFEPAAG